MFKNCYVRLYYFNFLISKLRLSSRLNKSLLNCRNNSSRTSHLASKILTVCPSEFNLCSSISEKFRSLKYKYFFHYLQNDKIHTIFLTRYAKYKTISFLVTTWKFWTVQEILSNSCLSNRWRRSRYVKRP
jgi:hypothetical protein